MKSNYGAIIIYWAVLVGQFKAVWTAEPLWDGEKKIINIPRHTLKQIILTIVCYWHNITDGWVVLEKEKKSMNLMIELHVFIQQVNNFDCHLFNFHSLSHDDHLYNFFRADFATRKIKITLKIPD